MSRKDSPGAPPSSRLGFGILHSDEAEYSRGILYLMWGRVIFLLLFLASVVVFNYGSILPPSAPEIKALLIPLLIYMVLSVLYFIHYYTYGSRRSLYWFALVQIILDLPLWMVLVALTGGPDSFFVFLFHTSIMIAAVYCGGRGIVFSLILAISLYILIAVAEPAGLVPPKLQPFVVIVQHEPVEFVYRVGIDGGSMILVAVLSWLLVLRVSTVGEKLRRTEAIFKDLDRLNEAVISLVPSGLITVDNAGQIRTLNQQAAGMLGFEGDTWQDTNITRLVDLSVEELLQPKLSKEITIRGAGGEKVYEVSVSALLNAQGERSGSVIHMLDITRMLKMQKDLARMERVSSLGNLAVGLAHEIRNPLGSISGSVEMIMKGPSFGEDDKKLLGIVAKEVKRIDNLVTSLLNLARQEEKLNRSTFRLAGLVDEVISVFKASEESSRVVFLSKIREDITVDADRDKIGQVLLNLIKNGAEAMAGQASGRISLEAGDAGNGKVEVRVVDEGSGIGAGEVEKIFEHYFTTKNWGIGVGLSVSRHILHKHDETIGYRPGREKGSIFYFTLKRAS